MSVFQRETSLQRTAKRLLSFIKEKNLKPGDRLPPERELARMMNISRPSLREALRALQSMNIIENKHGSGNYITSLEPKRLIQRLEAVFMLEDSTYSELFEARKILETGIAEIAAQRITDEEIRTLEAIVRKTRSEVDNPEAFLQLDLELHNVILKAAKNDILDLFMSSVNQLSLYSRRRTSERPEIRRQTLRDHKEIINALKRRDPEKSRAAMLEHLKRVERGLRRTEE